jgi:1-deoxy-D-xylulose-5-phosphate synthase
VNVLDRVDSPDSLKKLSMDELVELCKNLRERIIEVVSKRGGHLASSLGAVELTVAIHSVFDSPRDKIIWDVGHQSYAHKLLTGRRERFDTLRQLGGISGFPKRSESEYDAFGTGHASTAISAALGHAVARDLLGQDYKVVSIVGDGALTGGLSYEGLNQAGDQGRDIIVILNDNEMSIARNVGAMSKYLTKLLSAPIYRRLESDVWELLGRIPSVGSRARGVVRRIKEGFQNLIVPAVIFEELGFKYYGPVDGHDLPELIKITRQLKEVRGPVMLHVVTTKGKGYKFAEADSESYHGVGSFNPHTGASGTEGSRRTYTQVFGEAAMEIAEREPRLVTVTAAMPDGTGLVHFQEKYPDRFFDVGIAEAHAVTFSAGLAAAGMKPIAAIYSTFLQRAFDQIIHDVSLQRLNVVFAIDRAGIVGEDGPTHHGCLDLSYMRQVPNMRVACPRDEGYLRNMLWTAVSDDDGPMCIRYPRGAGEGVETKGDLRSVPIGVGEVLAEGADLVFLAVGPCVGRCMKAREILSGSGVDAGVVDGRWVKPLDEQLILRQSKRARAVVTVEENSIRGGFGSAVLECLVENDAANVKVLQIGIPDRFIEHGSRENLLDLVGLSPEKIADRTAEWLGELGIIAPGVGEHGHGEGKAGRSVAAGG